jgi:hypothetical protein
VCRPRGTPADPERISRFRAILGREVAALLGVRLHSPFIDLAVLLPALFPNTDNETLDDWLHHFNFRTPGRHRVLLARQNAMKGKGLSRPPDGLHSLHGGSLCSICDVIYLRNGMDPIILCFQVIRGWKSWR